MENGKGYFGFGLGFFLAGTAVGACAALLLAPATGKRTRERLSRKLRDTRESVTDLADDLADKTREIAAKAGRITDKAARLAEDASATARGVIGTLGEATQRVAGR